MKPIVLSLILLLAGSQVGNALPERVIVLHEVVIRTPSYKTGMAGQISRDVSMSNRRDTVKLQHLTVKEFKNRLAEIETGNHRNAYSLVNKFGYSGKYQLSRRYIARYARTDYRTFIDTPWVQEITMNRLCVYYLQSIDNWQWDCYVGSNINGITVTLEGLMAGYHQHPLALKKWLESDGEIDMTDGNRFPVSGFVKHFDIDSRKETI